MQKDRTNMRERERERKKVRKRRVGGRGAFFGQYMQKFHPHLIPCTSPLDYWHQTMWNPPADSHSL